MNRRDKPLALYYFGDRREAEPGLGPDVVGRSLRQRYDRPSGQRPLAVRGVGESGFGKYHGGRASTFSAICARRPLVEADRPAVEICSVPAVETISKTARVNGPRSVESVSVARIRVPHPVRIRLGGTGACTVGHISGRSAETVGLFVGEHSTSPASLCGSLFTEGKRPRAGSESVVGRVARTGTHEFRIRTFDTSEICRLSARYASGANTGHFAPAGTRDDFSSVSSSRRFADGSTVRSISDGPARSECPGEKPFLIGAGADSRSCGRTAIRILYYRKSGRGKSSYESVPTHGITCERRGPSRGGHPFP